MLLNFKQNLLLEKAIKLHNSGEIQKAIKIYSSLIKNNKNNQHLLFTLGTAHLQIGNNSTGIKYLKNFLDFNPNNASALLNMGNALKNLRKYDQAISNYNLAIVADPNFADAYNNRGTALKNLNRLEEAILSFDKAIKIKQDHFFAYNNRGIALKNLNRFEEAILSFNEAIKIKPNFIDAYNGRGNVYKNLKLYDKALLDYEKVLQLNPNYEYILGKVLHCKMFLSNWNNFDLIAKKIDSSIKNGFKTIDPFSYLGIIDDPETARKASETFVKYEFSNNVKNQILIKDKIKKPKIAYFSADFYDHPTLHLMMDVFKNHDKSKFDLFGFSFGPDKKDKWSNEVKNYFVEYLELNKTSDNDVINISRNLKIDIAVDLKGHTINNRSSIFLSRAAPIQINYLGYPGTTAIQNMDYIIADETIIPDEKFKFYSEKVLHLPDCYQANMRKREVSAIEIKRSQFGLPENGVVYCSFNNNYKITPHMFYAWLDILKKVDDSVLWILKTNDIAEKNIKNEAEKRGVNSNRIIFADYLQNDKHLKRLQLADLFLDTFPYNAHTTASDAVRMGVPLITLAGNSFASRVAASILKNLYMEDLITYNLKDYETLAIDLGLHSDKLKKIKKNLKDYLPKSPLFDSIKFTHNLENLYSKLLNI